MSNVRRHSETLVDRNRLARLKRTTDALCDSLHVAWRYAILLGSLRDAYRTHTKLNATQGRIVNAYWQALWDALFARIGTFYDRTPGTHSLPSLLKQLRRSKVPDLVALAATLQESLDRTAPVTTRFERWRNEVIGHSSESLIPERFNQEAVVHLSDVEELLKQVEELANLVSSRVLDRIVDVQYWNIDFASEATAFLDAVERSLVQRSESVQ